MITLEQVEKLREKTGVSYEEAKMVLEETGGDLLEAVILLERRNRIQEPESGGYYHSKGQPSEKEPTSGNRQKHSEQSQTKGSKTKKEDSVSFGELVGSFFSWCGRILHKGNNNNFEINKEGKNIMHLPLTVMALLLIFAFWMVIPLLIVGLIFGLRYRFVGPDLDKTEVNRAMETVSDVTMKAVDTVVDAAENFSKDIKKGKGEQTHGNENDSSSAGEAQDSDR
ncbi:MAG: DUF4342 domain-containing protein [Bacillota bacterium]|nr:DUF4342 domain-containing protein [Bacillota bacterium]